MVDISADTSSYPKPQPPTGPFDTIKNLQTIETNKLGIDQRKLDLMNQQYGLLHNELAGLISDPNVTPEKVLAAGQNWVKMGMIPPDMFAKFASQLPTQAQMARDPAALSTFLRREIARSQSTQEKINSFVGVPGFLKTGQQQIPVITSPFGGTRQTGAGVQEQIPPTTPVIGPDGKTVLQGPTIPVAPAGAATSLPPYVAPGQQQGTEAGTGSPQTRPIQRQPLPPPVPTPPAPAAAPTQAKPKLPVQQYTDKIISPVPGLNKDQTQAGPAPAQSNVSPAPVPAPAPAPTTKLPVTAPIVPRAVKTEKATGYDLAQRGYPAPSGPQTGFAPGVAEAATKTGAASGEQLAMDRQHAANFQREIFPLAQAIPALEALGTKGTGPGTETINHIKSFVLSNVPGVKPEDFKGTVKDYDIAKKYLTDFVNQTGSSGTNDKLAAAFAGNPSVNISNAAAVDVAKSALALRRMRQAQILNFEKTGLPDDKYSKWVVETANALDPRAFGVDLMSPEAKTKLKAELDRTSDNTTIAKRLAIEKGIFERSLQMAHDANFITPTGH